MYLNEKCVLLRLANKDDKIELLKPLKNLPTLVLALSETRKAFLFNTETGQLICELNYDDDDSQWRPIIAHADVAYSAKNHQLFLKCKSTSEVFHDSKYSCMLECSKSAFDFVLKR
jgi:hypothetical protein